MPVDGRRKVRPAADGRAYPLGGPRTALPRGGRSPVGAVGRSGIAAQDLSHVPLDEGRRENAAVAHLSVDGDDGQCGFPPLDPLGDRGIVCQFRTVDVDEPADYRLSKVSLKALAQRVRDLFQRSTVRSPVADLVILAGDDHDFDAPHLWPLPFPPQTFTQQGMRSRLGKCAGVTAVELAYSATAP